MERQTRLCPLMPPRFEPAVSLPGKYGRCNAGSEKEEVVNYGQACDRKEVLRFETGVTHNNKGVRPLHLHTPHFFCFCHLCQSTLPLLLLRKWKDEGPCPVNMHLKICSICLPPVMCHAFAKTLKASQRKNNNNNNMTRHVV